MSLISGILVERSCDVVRMIIIIARTRQDISCTVSAWSEVLDNNEDPK